MSGCGHRTVYQSDFGRMDVLFRKLLRMLVGAPGYLDWSRPWHEILHEWNMKVQTIVSEHQVKLWSHRCLESYWKFGLYIANLLPGRWVPRALHWKPAGARVAGHPRNDWKLKFQSYTRHRQTDDWHTLASNMELWTHLTEDFAIFSSGRTQ